MNKYPSVVLLITALCTTSFPVFAGSVSCGEVKITSSQVLDDGVDSDWLVSGSCLEEVDKVALANDAGNGFEELSFAHVDTGGSTSLQIPRVSRRGLDNNIPIGEYLLQVSKCETKKGVLNCSVLDEKHLAVQPPQAGDACTTTYDEILFDSKRYPTLYGCDAGPNPEFYLLDDSMWCSFSLVWECINGDG